MWFKRSVTRKSNVAIDTCQILMASRTCPTPVLFDLSPQEMQQFTTNTYLTDEAAIALLRIIERTHIRYVTLSELVQWLEQDGMINMINMFIINAVITANRVEGTIKRMFDFPTPKRDRSRKVKLSYYERPTHATPGNMLVILNALCKFEPFYFNGWIQQYVLANSNKTLLFLYSNYAGNTTLSFVKVRYCSYSTDFAEFLDKTDTCKKIGEQIHEQDRVLWGSVLIPAKKIQRKGQENA